MAGLPAMLGVLALTGVLRGLQDTRTPLVVAVVANLVNVALNYALVYGLDLGIAGSALGTVLSQWASVVAFLVVVVAAARRLRVSLALSMPGVLGSFRASAPLVLRTASLRLVIVLAAFVAAQMGSAELAAHQVAFTIWAALALGLDAVAIAGQALVGRYLGAADLPGTKDATQRMVEWSIGMGAVLGVIVLAVHTLLPHLFTPDAEVQHYLADALVIVALLQPAAGWVFALDGVLIGAGDARYLAATQALTVVAFLPLATAVLAFDLGLTALWVAIGGWIMARLCVLVWRVRTDEWAVVGATR